MEKSEPGKNTKDSALDEEEIIELYDVVESPDAEEIIELTDPADDDGVIELTDEADEEEVIELTDTIEMSLPDEEVSEPADVMEPVETAIASDDDIIDLSDPVEALAPEASEIADEDELIELTDISEEEVILDDEPIDLTDAAETEAAVIEGEPETQDELDETERTLDLLDTLESDRISELAEEQGRSTIPESDTVIRISADHVSPEEYSESKEIFDAGAGGHEDADSKDDVFSDHSENDIAELNDIAEVLRTGDEEEDSDEQDSDEEADIIIDDQDYLDLEADLLEADEEIDIPGEDQSAYDYERENEFSESLGSDLGSVLIVSDKDDRIEQEGAKKLDRPGVVTVQVSDKRKKGAPIDFKFESKLHPGDKIIRESDDCRDKESITQEQVKMTIEKVVREMLSEKIDLILTEVIEKAVSSEIQKIKKALLEDIEVQDD